MNHSHFPIISNIVQCTHIGTLKCLLQTIPTKRANRTYVIKFLVVVLDVYYTCKNIFPNYGNHWKCMCDSLDINLTSNNRKFKDQFLALGKIYIMTSVLLLAYKFFVRLCSKQRDLREIVSCGC